VGKTEQKNYRLDVDLLSRVTAYIEQSKDRGVQVREGQVVAAGLLAFLTADEATRALLLQRASGFQFEKLIPESQIRPENGSGAPGQVAAAAREILAGQRARRTPARAKKHPRSASGG
jgi:hypothetical protein